MSCHAAFRRAWPASASVPVTLADSETDPRIAALAACSSHATGSLGLLRPGLVLMVADGRPHPGRGRVTSVKFEGQRSPLFELRLPPPPFSTGLPGGRAGLYMHSSSLSTTMRRQQSQCWPTWQHAAAQWKKGRPASCALTTPPARTHPDVFFDEWLRCAIQPTFT